jgi:hypothetical protein
LNIGKKGLFFIIICFLLLAVLLSYDVTRDAMFNGLGMFSVTLQSWVVGGYTAVTTNALYLQWHVLIQGVIWISLTTILVTLYYKGKLNKLSALVGKAAPTTPGYQNTLTSTIPMQQAPVQQVAAKPKGEVEKSESTA